VEQNNKEMEIKDYANTKETFKIEYLTDLECFKTNIGHNVDMGKYYSYENYQSHNQNEKGIFNNVYKWAQKYNLNYKYKLIKKLNSNNKYILDYGCGVGDFITKMRNEGWQTQAFEPNEKAREILLRNNIKSIENLNELPDDSQDIITLWHVLEHLEDPIEKIKALKNKLKPDGTLLIAVPNFNAYDAKFYKNRWAAYDVPRHIYHFQRKSFEEIAKLTKLKIVKTEPLCLDAFYVSLLSENYSVKKNVLRAICVGLISNMKSIWTKEYSSIIYFLKKTT
jgi:2-polyprenyl-3-methyl-5-hydroxy-6-metoxy-1,4-benzoquinol methylase